MMASRPRYPKPALTPEEGILFIRTQLFPDVSLFVKSGDKHKGVMIEGEPSLLGNCTSDPLFLHCYGIHRVVVIGHDPEGIEMGVCRQDITEMVCALAF